MGRMRRVEELCDGKGRWGIRYLTYARGIGLSPSSSSHPRGMHLADGPRCLERSAHCFRRAILKRRPLGAGGTGSEDYHPLDRLDESNHEMA